MHFLNKLLTFNVQNPITTEDLFDWAGFFSSLSFYSCVILFHFQSFFINTRTPFGIFKNRVQSIRALSTLDEPCNWLIKLVLSGLTNQNKSLVSFSVTYGQMFLSQVLFQLISCNFMPFISDLSIFLWNKL